VDRFSAAVGQHLEIKALAVAEKSIKQITRSTGRSRKLARSVVRGGNGDVFRRRIRALVS